MRAVVILELQVFKDQEILLQVFGDSLQTIENNSFSFDVFTIRKQTLPELSTTTLQNISTYLVDPLGHVDLQIPCSPEFVWPELPRICPRPASTRRKQLIRPSLRLYGRLHISTSTLPLPSNHLFLSNQSLTHAPLHSKIPSPSDKARSARHPAPPHPLSIPPPPPCARAPIPQPSTPRSVADPAIVPLAAPATTSSMPGCRIATRTPMIRAVMRRQGQWFREVRVISRS